MLPTLLLAAFISTTSFFPPLSASSSIINGLTPPSAPFSSSSSSSSSASSSSSTSYLSSSSSSSTFTSSSSAQTTGSTSSASASTGTGSSSGSGTTLGPMTISESSPDATATGSTTPPTTEAVLSTLGFERLDGNCKGATIGRQMEIPVEGCARLCADNEFCAGFSYAEEFQTCYLKEKACNDPDPNHPFRFYKKVNFREGRGIPLGYKELEGNCRGHTVSAGLSLSLEQCAEKCNETYNCAGFSHSVQAELCYLKAAWCEQPKADSLYKFYKKDIADERFELPGYLKHKGNCKGNIIGNRNFGELAECAFRCTDDPTCVGFSFSREENTCFMKSVLCLTPTLDGNYNYYEKMGPNSAAASGVAPATDEAGNPLPEPSPQPAGQQQQPPSNRRPAGTTGPLSPTHSEPSIVQRVIDVPRNQKNNRMPPSIGQEPQQPRFSRRPGHSDNHVSVNMKTPPVSADAQMGVPHPPVNINWRFPKDNRLAAPAQDVEDLSGDRGRNPLVVTKRLGDSAASGHGHSGRRTSKMIESDWEYEKKLRNPYEGVHRRTLIAPKRFAKKSSVPIPTTGGVAPPNGTIDALTDVSGYFRFAGNCPGHYLAGSPDATSLQDCANLCTKREDCAGFSFDPIDLSCVLKSADCWPPQSGSRQIFYHKDTKWQGQTPEPAPPAKVIGDGKGGGGGGGGGSGEASGEGEAYQHRFPEIPGYLRLEGNCQTEILGIEEIPNAKACGAHCSLYAECAGFSFNFYHYKCILRSVSCMNPRESQHTNFYEKIITPVTITDESVGGGLVGASAGSGSNATTGELFGREFVAGFSVSEDSANMQPYLEITGHRTYLGDVFVNITNEDENYHNYVKIGFDESIVVDLPPIVNLSEPAIPNKIYSGRKFKVIANGGEISVKKGYYITSTMTRRGGQQSRPALPGTKTVAMPYTYIVICQLESKYCTSSMTVLFNSTQLVISGAPWLSGALIEDPANNAQVTVTTYEGKRKSFTRPLSTSDLTFTLNEGDQVDIKPGKSGILTGTSISASNALAIVAFGGSVARPMSDPPGAQYFGKIKAQVMPSNVLSFDYMVVCHPRAITCAVTICPGTPVKEPITVTLKHDSLLGDKRVRVLFNDEEERMAGPVMTITMTHEFDTIQVFSRLLDLTGLRVTAAPNNSKIAVFVDLEIDSHFGTVQVPPLTHFAGRYLVQQADFRSTRVEEAVIVAVEPSTQVQILSSKLRILLERSGDTYVTPLVSDIVTSIFATTPLIVLHTVIPDTTVRAISLQFVPTPPAWQRQVVIGRPSNVTTNATQLASLIIRADQIDKLEWNGEPLTGIKVEPILGTDFVIGRFAVIRPEQLGVLQHVTQLVPFQVAVTDWNTRTFEYIGYRIRGKCNAGPHPPPIARAVPVLTDIESACDLDVASDETCGDKIDNDHDGLVDENCPPTSGYCRTVSNEGIDDFPFMYLLNQPWISRNFLPEVYVITREGQVDGQIYVECTAPAASNTYLGETVLLNALQTTFFPLPSYFLPEGSEHATKGLRVRPVRPLIPISVFLLNRENGSVGGSLILPRSILGKRYFSVMWSPTIGGGEIGVMAVNDFTKVTLTLPNPIVPITINFRNKVYTNKDKLTIILPKYNTLHIVSEKTMSDLSGTEILANDSVAAFSGNMAAIIPMDYVGPMNDHTFEQLIPVDYWDQVYILPIGPDATADDYFKITAAYPGTVVTVYGLDEGGNLSLPNIGSTTLIKVPYMKKACLEVVASKPVQIAMFLSSSVGRDPSMVIIPPVKQWRNNYVFTTADMTKTSTELNDYTNYVLLAYHESGHGKLQLNTKRVGVGRVVQTSTPNSATYLCSYVRLPTPGFQHLLSEGGDKFLAIVFGHRLHESYAYAAGLAFDQYIPCQPCQAYFPCDNIDNDCDGSKDEEICDGTDNDGDGLVDEDCCGGLGTLDVPGSGCYDVQNAEFCYGWNASIACPDTEDIENRKKISILSAHFGRSGRVGEAACSNVDMPFMTSCPFHNVYNQTRIRCEGKYSCTFNVSLSILGSLPSNFDVATCPLCRQYMRVSYVCLSKAQRNCSDLATRQFSQPYVHYTASSYAQPSLNVLNSTSVCRKSEDIAAVAERNKYFPPEPLKCATCDIGEEEQPGQTNPNHPMYAFFDSDGNRGWCAAPCDLEHPYLQLDLGMVYPLTGFVVQGRRTHDHFVSQFMLSYSTDGREWQKVMENGLAKLFDGNTNGWDVTFCDLRRFQVLARYVRMDIIAWSGHPCAHFEVVRCSNGTGCTPMSVPNSNMLEFGSAPDKSYRFSCKAGFYNGRNQTNDNIPLERSFTVNCSKDGTWRTSSDFPCSDDLGCGPVPEMPMSVHMASNMGFGSQVVYSCLDGKRITSNITIACQDDGTWSQPALKCDTYEDITDP